MAIRRSPSLIPSVHAAVSHRIDANEPPIREPSPAHIAAQEAYIAAARERTKALGEVVRLEDELSRAQMSTSEVTVLHGLRNQARD